MWQAAVLSAATYGNNLNYWVMHPVARVSINIYNHHSINLQLS
jgi:hypothetical protein